MKYVSLFLMVTFQLGAGLIFAGNDLNSVDSLVKLAKSKIASDEFSVKPLSDADVVGMLMASRIETAELNEDYVEIAIKFALWGRSDLLQLMWWESSISARREFLLALLIGEGKSDIDQEYLRYFERAINQFGGRSGDLRRKELLESKHLGDEVKILFWTAKERAEKASGKK